ncbi:AraC family transcriptional regulator [Paenibacillus rigui]|uniref:AraC family transcriptional regulator n=1 Tax=Paenibacillus rigui TaxID=554312 RepID=A0A229UQC2_9BACL|nr:helix-turn-helix domain-containing protein [Paenibacillus rigui]OXM85570.1 AraC family transcriptional regulator [Paenibacillus rigui]
MLMKSFAGYQAAGHWIWVQRSSHGLHNLLPEHRHDYIELVYVVHGEGRHQIGSEQYDIRTGDVYVVLPGELHSYPDVQEADLEIINCLFVPESVRILLPHLTDSFMALPYIAPFYGNLSELPRRLHLTSVQSTEIVVLLEEMIQEGYDRKQGFSAVNRLKLMDMLVRLSRFAMQGDRNPGSQQPSSSGHEILVRRVKYYMETNYQHKLTVSEIAREFNLSERHLNRIMKQETGRSVTAMLQYIRIERAKQMLGETERSIEAIATAVGFGDTSFFTRLFSRLAGETPGSFRKKAKYRRIQPAEKLD